MSLVKLKELPNIHLFKWIKSRKLTIPSAVKDVGQRGIFIVHETTESHSHTEK